MYKTEVLKVISLKKPFFAALLVMAAALLLLLLPAAPASAHHGWSSFDTRYAYYATGTLTDVRWGNPHTEATLRVEGTDLPNDWPDRELPSGALEEDGQLTMASARPYQGGHKELHLVLAGPEWMARWGLDRELEVGEKIEVVGYLNSNEEGELRPVMFWLENGQGIWQQLTAFPENPEPAPNNSYKIEAQSATSEEPATDDVTGSDEQGSSSVVIWLVVGIVIVVALVIGGFYLRRQGNRS